MSKKKRFQKTTLGKLGMFFAKKAYMAFNNMGLLTVQSDILVSLEKEYFTKLNHYKKKKKKNNILHPQQDSPAQYNCLIH